MSFFCIHCRSEIDSKFKACPYCGEPITDFLRRHLEHPIDIFILELGINDAFNGIPLEQDGTGLGAEFNLPVSIASDGSQLYAIDAPENLYTTDLRQIIIHGATPPPSKPKITMFSLPSATPGPQQIASNAKSAYLWVTERWISSIARVSTNGAVKDFHVPITPYTIAAGNDGTPWYLSQGAHTVIGHLSVSGQVTQWTIPFGTSTGSLCLGPDGNMWFTSPSYNGPDNKIGVVLLH